MRNIIVSFKQLIKTMLSDSMLIMLLGGSVFMGILIKLGIPCIDEYIIMKHIGFYDLYIYYPLIDLFLYIMVPMFICFIPAMVVLEEIDDKTSNYLIITPLGRSGYLLSRIVFPCAFAFIETVIISLLCSIGNSSPMKILILDFLSCLIALSLTMLIVCVAKNRVEGMAICKISSVLLLGMVVPFFINNSYQFIVSFLPSLWLARYSINNNPQDAIICIIVTLIWIYILYRKYYYKIG